ncbi:MAG: hypothetical protein WA624_23900 [Methylocella sp.]
MVSEVDCCSLALRVWARQEVAFRPVRRAGGDIGERPHPHRPDRGIPPTGEHRRA